MIWNAEYDPAEDGYGDGSGDGYGYGDGSGK